MEQEEPPGGAVALKQNSDAVKQTQETVQSSGSDPTEAPNPVQTQNPDLDQTEADPTEDLNQSPAQVPTKPDTSPGSEDPNLVQTNDQDQHQTLVLTKPTGPGQSPAQSIVVRVPAMALLKALAQSTGQTKVRIPLQTHGPGSVLVPSTAPSHIHLMASVQSLAQSPGLVQNQVVSSGVILSPTRTTGPGPGLALVRPPGPITNLVPGPGLVQNQVQISFSNQAQGQPKTPIQVQVRGPDPDLVQIPLPREAVRALSPPLTTTPLKPSVPPLGFRLNGRLIPLLSGTEGLELSICSHPRGSKSSLTSLRLKQAPPSCKRKAPPSCKRKAPPLTCSSAPVTGSPEASTATPTKTVTSCVPRPPTEPTEPRPHVTPPKPHPQKPKVFTRLRKEPTPAPPPDCARCESHFRAVPALRGFICMCSSEVSAALQTLDWKRKDERLKSKLKKLSVLKHKFRTQVSKPQSFHSAAAVSICDVCFSLDRAPVIKHGREELMYHVTTPTNQSESCWSGAEGAKDEKAQTVRTQAAVPHTATGDMMCSRSTDFGSCCFVGYSL